MKLGNITSDTNSNLYLINFSTIAFAGKPVDPNCFGDSASDLGGDLGEHSRDAAAGDHPYDDDGK